MKVTNFFFLIFLFISTSQFAQETIEISSKKHTYGILMEGNYGYFGEGEIFCDNFSCLNGKDGFGFALGILYQYQITNFLGIRPQALISFSDMNTDFTFDLPPNQPSPFYAIEDYVALTFPVHFLLTNPKWKQSPHVLLGGRYSYQLTETDRNDSFYNYHDLAVDLGIGWEWQFDRFNFSPEIVSTFGLVDVIKNEFIENNTNRNSIALRLVFRG